MADQPGKKDPNMGERVLTRLPGLVRWAVMPADIIELLRTGIHRRPTDRIDKRRPRIYSDTDAVDLLNAQMAKHVSSWRLTPRTDYLILIDRIADRGPDARRPSVQARRADLGINVVDHDTQPRCGNGRFDDRSHRLDSR
jgi:hypothetical protein